MGMHNPLGYAGGAGRIDNVERGFWSRLHIGRARAVRCHPVVDFFQSNVIKFRQEIFSELRRFHAVDKQMHRAAVARHADQLIFRSTGGQRRSNSPCTHRRQKNQCIVDAACAENRD